MKKPNSCDTFIEINENNCDKKNFGLGIILITIDGYEATDAEYKHNILTNTWVDKKCEDNFVQIIHNVEDNWENTDYILEIFRKCELCHIEIVKDFYPKKLSKHINKIINQLKKGK